MPSSDLSSKAAPEADPLTKFIHLRLDNAVVNQLFGISTGLGMSLLTFDWSMVSYIGNPLVVPWWAEANIFVGFFLTFWVFAPIMYYTNVRMPITLRLGLLTLLKNRADVELGVPTDLLLGGV